MLIIYYKQIYNHIMLTQLTLTYSQQSISQFLLSEFSTENESAITFQSFEHIYPFKQTLAIIGHNQGYKVGPLQWGQIKDPHLLTINKKIIDQSLILTKHYKTHRCLILVNGFYLKNLNNDFTYYASEINEGPLLLAGLYYTTITNKVKANHVSIITTTSIDQYAIGGSIIPVVLNHDQYRFWLNPETIPSELNFLLLPDNFKRLKFQTVLV